MNEATTSLTRAESGVDSPCGVRELPTLGTDALHVDGKTPSAAAHIPLAPLLL